MDNHRGFRLHWIKFLFASYNFFGWLRGKFLSAAIRASDTKSIK